jgi:hypothetical protein
MKHDPTMVVQTTLAVQNYLEQLTTLVQMR